MNRRGFLSLLAPAAAALAIPVLWIPKRTFFLPPAGGWNAWMDAAIRAQYEGLPLTSDEQLALAPKAPFLWDGDIISLETPYGLTKIYRVGGA